MRQILLIEGHQYLLVAFFYIPDQHFSNFIRFKSMNESLLPLKALVSLRQDIEQFELRKGDVGKITLIDHEAQEYVVTFKNFQGESKAWVRLREDQIRPV